MAQQVKPRPTVEFHGVLTNGNPIRRSASDSPVRLTAAVCRDLRIMPGYWLRLRGGRTARYNVVGPVATCLQVAATHDINIPGATFQFGQFLYSGPTAVYWHSFSTLTYVIPPTANAIEQISLAYDSSFSSTNPAASETLARGGILYNGLGVRDPAGASTPPITSYFNNIVRYWGLDAYCPSGNPTVAFAAGAGNNVVLNSVDIWVGIYNSDTEHYSNGVKAGTITVTGATGTITVSNLQNLKWASHNTTEQSTLAYCFYATIDGGQIPYLILNSTLTGPHTVAIASTTASLSIASGTTNGWVLDLAHEMPIDNFPPRPMRSVAFVRDRVYGAPLAGGSGASVVQARPGGAQGADFQYQWPARDLAGVVWSMAAGDTTEKDLLGDPLQCWPLSNIRHTPSAEQPLLVKPALDEVRVLVLTATSSFYLEEQADGLHTYLTISRTHGIGSAASFRTTDYGQIWVDQRNQIVLLPPGATRLQILSKAYQSLLDGKTVRWADYLLNPPAEIDRYEVFFTDGTSVIHDFEIGGEGYACTGKDFTAGGTVTDGSGKIHHIVANTGLYTQEAQPETGLVPTGDDSYSNAVDQTFTTAEVPQGEYLTNWDDFGDDSNRKALPYVDMIGDGENASVEWYGDFEEVLFPGALTDRTKVNQSATDSKFRFKLAAAQRFWYKLRFLLNGHRADKATYPPASTEGSLAANFYGSIVGLDLHQEQGINRP